MVDILSIIQIGLIYGLVLSLLLGILVMGSLRLNPEIWLHDYPPEIQARYGPISEKAKKQGRVISVFFLLLIFGLPALSIWQLHQAGSTQPGFWEIFLNVWVILMVFNLFDLLILDWLILATLQPRFAILPGTEGMAEYHDYRRHFIGFLKGIVFTLVGSLVIAGLAVIVRAIFA